MEKPAIGSVETPEKALSKEEIKEKVKTILPERKEVNIESAHNHNVFTFSDPVKILLTFALFIILFAIAFFLSYINTQRETFEKQVEEDIVPEAEIKLPDDGVVDLSNWETYSNQKIGFSLEYPSDSLFTETNVPLGTTIAISHDKYYVTVEVEPSPLQTDLDTRVKQKFEQAITDCKTANPQGFDATPIGNNSLTFPGINAKYFSTGYCKRTYRFVYLFSHGQYFFTVDQSFDLFYADSEERGLGIYQEITDQILSTFKFLN